MRLCKLYSPFKHRQPQSLNLRVFWVIVGCINFKTLLHYSLQTKCFSKRIFCHCLLPFRFSTLFFVKADVAVSEILSQYLNLNIYLRLLEQLWTGVTRLSQKCQSKKAESKIGKLSFCFFLGGPPRSDLSPMTKATVSQSPIPLIFLLYKACPSLTSVPEGRLFSALHRWSLKQLCHHIVWCTVAAGDRALCQGRNSLMRT